ncbi:MAG TPA: TonB family protein [Archangium sp.]|uniref:energy transducer TonB n=1 Tax=Archangium sp. TaxID=1872627 RepID=UPI002E303D0B|nr:TonB family protein [Archangium sp.]HEX5747248.1 TonB family protein [Archangium sp.]
MAPARQDARPAVGLFRMGEASSTGERERWAWALVSAGLVHAVALVIGLSLPHSTPKAAPLPEEPEVVFFSFPPPPAAASGATAAPAPERVQHQARTRAPRIIPTLAMKTPVPEPVEAPVETANPETVPETPPELEEAPASEATGNPGVQGVVAGIVGGVLDGREGGLLGATGGSALELKQVARAPEVLAQVQPRYPRRAKADGIQGLVLVRIIIGTDGRVEPEHTRVIRSVPELDAAAISAVSQWRFSPALGHQGRPVRVIVEIPVQFSLK